MKMINTPSTRIDHQNDRRRSTEFERTALRYSTVILFSLMSFYVSAANKTYDPISEDPVVLDKSHPPLVHEVIFESTGVKLYGKVFSAQGTTPHPTVLIARGYPDMTSSADIALTLQRAGYNAMIFNYRGSWGMGGVFSLEHSFQDLKAATAFLRSYKTSKNMLVDPNNILLYGYSLGGPIVLRLAAEDSKIRGAVLLDGFDTRAYLKMAQSSNDDQADGMANPAVPTANGRTIAADVTAHYSDWDVSRYVSGLSGKNIMLAWASQGNGGRTVEYGTTLHDYIAKSARVTEKTFNTNHDFSDQRITLARSLLAWLKQVRMEPASFTPQPLMSDRKEIVLAPAQHAKYLGTYQFAGIKIFVRSVGDHLEVADANQEWKVVTALEDNRFLIKENANKDCNEIEANENSGGQIVSYTQHCAATDRVWKHTSSELQFPPERASIALDDSVLAGYAGKYQIPHVNAPMEIRVEGKRIIAIPSAGEKVIMYAQSETRFFDKVAGTEMEFVKNEKGAVSQIIVHVNGKEFLFTKL